MDNDIGIHEITNKIQTKNVNFTLYSETYHEVIRSKKGVEQLRIMRNCWMAENSFDGVEI